MIVTVRSVETGPEPTYRFAPSVLIGRGLDQDGREVTFAGDIRQMMDIAEAIARGEEPEAEVPDWAVL